MKARFLKASKLNNLRSKIQENLDFYRNGNFDFISTDPDCFFETELEIQEDILSSITCTATDINEVDSCMKIFEAFGPITQYLARDERLWTYLTHTLLLAYTRTRWPIPNEDEKAVKHIKAHFFCIGARGVERDNAASRLWWLASLCSRSSNLTLQQALRCFLLQTDVRANIVERPTTSQNVTVFSAVLTRLNESYDGDKQLFDRDRFRSVMKNLNLKGGVKLLAALPEPAIFNILDECIVEAG